MENSKSGYSRISVRVETEVRDQIYSRALEMGVRPSAYAQVALSVGERALWSLFQQNEKGQDHIVNNQEAADLPSIN